MITRDPESSSQNRYDLIIVGGGIYGVCLSLEASRRGLKSVLLERDDFGGATSWNSLRILHGGLRYLQQLDLARFRESVAERHWFCKNFPDLVRPLPCVMPLYGRGLKRKAVFGPALRLNDWLSSDRNDGVADLVKLANGRILSTQDTKRIFDKVDEEALEGAGLWHDAVMVNSQRVLIELLHWSCNLGGVALNYVEARELMTENNHTIGVRGWDKVGGRLVEWRAPVVINCAGPWSRHVAAQFDREVPHLFNASLAFNVFVEQKPLSKTALAIQPRHPNSQVYFLHPVKTGFLLGTVHATWTGPVSEPAVDEALIGKLISEVNLAVPGFGVKRNNVRRVLGGFLPACRPGCNRISRRPFMHLHSREGGPHGLLSICGVKFTTARLVAEQALAAVSSSWQSLPRDQERCKRRPQTKGLDLESPGTIPTDANSTIRTEIARVLREESVTCITDLVMRRTDWGLDPNEAKALIKEISNMHPDLPLQIDQFAKPTLPVLA